MATLAKVLKEMEKEWKNTEPAEVGERVQLDDGNYVCVLEQPRVELAKSSERLQIAWPMKFTEGKYEGKRATKYDGLDNGVSISFAKATMETLGIDIPKSMTKLPEVLEEFFENDYNKREVNVNVSNRDGFTNIYINGYVDEDDGGKKKGSRKEEEEEEEEGKPEYDGPSPKKIKKMEKKELKKLIKEYDLDTDPSDYEDEEELAEAVADEVKNLL